MDINKEFEKLAEEFEKEWHDGHEPQGIDDQYVEEMEDEELDEKKSLKLRDLNFYPTPKKKGKKVSGSSADRPMAFGISRKGGSGPGKGYGSAKKAPIMMGDEVDEEKEEDEAYGGTKKWKKGQNKMKKAGIALHKKDKFSGYVEKVDEEPAFCSTPGLSSSLKDKCTDAKKADREREAKKKKNTNISNIARKVGAGTTYNEFDPELGEGYKDLPPHLQKLVKKIEKKQKDWNKQNPKAQIKTLVYNPETGKPDIEIKEKTMKLEDTVKEVLEGKKKKGAYEDNTNDKSDDGDGLDKVQPKAVKKKFKDRKDKDIDNDGDVDDSDKFLHKRRKAVSKAVSKEEKSYSKLFTTVMSLLRGK